MYSEFREVRILIIKGKSMKPNLVNMKPHIIKHVLFSIGKFKLMSIHLPHNRIWTYGCRLPIAKLYLHNSELRSFTD